MPENNPGLMPFYFMSENFPRLQLSATAGNVTFLIYCWLFIFFQPRTNLFLHSMVHEVSEAANCVRFVCLFVLFQVRTDLNDSGWTCSYWSDCDDTWFYRFFAVQWYSLPVLRGFKKTGSAFQSFDGRPGVTIIQAHVDLFPFINTHSQRRCDRREEEHSCGSCLL